MRSKHQSASCSVFRAGLKEGRIKDRRSYGQVGTGRNRGGESVRERVLHTWVSQREGEREREREKNRVDRQDENIGHISHSEPNNEAINIYIYMYIYIYIEYWCLLLPSGKSRVRRSP